MNVTSTWHYEPFLIWFHIPYFSTSNFIPTWNFVICSKFSTDVRIVCVGCAFVDMTLKNRLAFAKIVATLSFLLRPCLEQSRVCSKYHNSPIFIQIYSKNHSFEWNFYRKVGKVYNGRLYIAFHILREGAKIIQSLVLSDNFQSFTILCFHWAVKPLWGHSASLSISWKVWKV